MYWVEVNKKVPAVLKDLKPKKLKKNEKKDSEKKKKKF